MVRRDGAEVRRERIQNITKRVMSLLAQSSAGEIPLSKTVGILEYETGLTRYKVMEYLRIGEAAERFIIDVEADKIKKASDS
jgi:hypothetical protein